jgi:cytochrome c
MRTAAKTVCLLAAMCAFAALPAVAAAQDFPDATRFQKVTLNDRPGEPMSLAVLPDGRVLHSARTGEIRIHNPRTGLNRLVADMRESPEGLYQHDEEGVQGIALDPNFSNNRWVYVYYSPALDTPVDDPETGGAVNEGDAPFNIETEEDRERLELFKGYLLLSRFKLTGNELDFESEQQILRVPVDRGICCHVGGKIDFDGEGNLYLSTGDDTNPFESEGYSPIDERDTRNPAFDAQRTSANTNDLRGKILRIRVTSDGDYSVPAGNLFRPGTARTKPEIYAMGFRNPFRMAVDKTSNNVYVGDYSPDADEDDPARGPAGYGRWMLIERPGNYGWPYCFTRTLGYVDYDFETEASGDEFNCNSPRNDSPHNTGRRQLPDMVNPDVWYSYPDSDPGLFPELFEDLLEGDGIGPMGGPAYEFRAGNRSETKWPRVFDGQPLFYEWTRDIVKVFELNRPHGDRLTQIHNLFPGGPNGIIQDNPMDMEFGPDGSLYTLEYGDGFFVESPDAALSRIDFVRGGERTPIPKVTADKTSSLTPPLTVNFSSAGTSDPNGDRLTYAWDFDADGTVDSRQPNASFTYTERGIWDATLRVTDSTGRSASASVEIIVGNQAPVVELTVTDPSPPFAFGDAVNFTVEVTDEQPVDCSRVTVAYILGHDQHGHPQSSTGGCSGTIQTPPPDAGHQGENIFAVFVASYTDQPAGEEPQTGSDEVVLRPGE